MRTLTRNMISKGTFIPKSQFMMSQTPFMMTTPIRSFSLPRYHFDDKDYEPTVEEVSGKKLNLI